MDKEAQDAARRFAAAFDKFLETPVMQALCFMNPATASDPRVQEMLSAYELMKAHNLIADSHGQDA